MHVTLILILTEQISYIMVNMNFVIHVRLHFFSFSKNATFHRGIMSLSIKYLEEKGDIGKDV